MNGVGAPSTPMIADATQISAGRADDADARELDAIVQAAWVLYQHLIRRGCSEESAAGAADLLVEEEYRKRRCARQAQRA